MTDISIINEKVSRVLRDENNEVVYKAWLSFTEGAELRGSDLVINVPNQFIKEALENRYSSDIEELYRNELPFSKLVFKSETDNFIQNDKPQLSSVATASVGFVPEYRSFVCW